MLPFAVRRLLFVWLLLAGVLPPAAAQTATTNSLRRALRHTPPDSTRVLLLLQLAYTYRSYKPDSTMYLAQETWQLARRVGFEKWAFMGELSAGIAHGAVKPAGLYAKLCGGERGTS